jgi:cell division protein FtsN
MNISKFFVTAAAAVTVVGAIGFAYAQTTYDPATTTIPQTQNQTTMPNQPAPGASIATPSRAPNSASGPLNDGSTGSMNQGSTSATSNERPPRADRN